MTVWAGQRRFEAMDRRWMAGHPMQRWRLIGDIVVPRDANTTRTLGRERAATDGPNERPEARSAFHGCMHVRCWAKVSSRVPQPLARWVDSGGSESRG